MFKEGIDYTITYNALKALNIIASNDLLDVDYNFKLLYKLVRVNSKFYEEFQPYLSTIEERLQEALAKMALWQVI